MAAAARELITESWELGASVASPRIGRDAVRGLLAGLVPQHLLDTALLLTSELVTNAAIHARSSAVLTVALTPRSVTISVSDGSRKAAVSKEAQFEGPSGRGILIVDRLSTIWGVHPHVQGGKTVWCQVDRRGGTVQP